MTGAGTSVEIVIPAFNAERTIGRTLVSVCAQTLPLCRVTVVDDASTDGTESIVRRFPGVRYVRNDKGLGMAGNWQHCSALVSAPFFAILHHDDVLLPNWHSRVQEAVSAVSEMLPLCLVVGSALVDRRGCVRAPLSFSSSASLHQPGRLLELLWKRGCYGVAPSGCMVYSLEVFKRKKGFPVDAYPNMADVPLHWELLLTESIFYVPEVLVLLQTGLQGRGSEVYRDELMVGALGLFDRLRPRIAPAAKQSQARLVADYILPYYVAKRVRHREISSEAVRVLRCLRDSTTRGYLTLALMRALVERIRRGWLMMRLSRRLKAAWEVTAVGSLGSGGRNV